MEAVRMPSKAQRYPGAHLTGLLGLEDEEPPSCCWRGDLGVMSPGQVLREVKLPGASSCCLSPSDETPLIPSLPLTCKGQNKRFGFAVGNLSGSFVNNNNFIVDNGAHLGRIDCKILFAKSQGHSRGCCRSRVPLTLK